jgi:hypothetical protein
MKSISRRDFLKVGGVAMAGTVGGAAWAQKNIPQPALPNDICGVSQIRNTSPLAQMQHSDNILSGTVGKVDHEDIHIIFQNGSDYPCFGLQGF